MIGTLGKWIVWTCLFLLGFGTSGLASDRPTVILYTVAGCRPCQSALRSLQELSIDLRVTQDCPAWVTQVPVIHWRDRAGVWRQHAPSHWSGKNWSDAEAAKIRRWLLPSSATKSTGRGGYLTVTSDSLPAPYYQRGPVTLYHGDCLELLNGLPEDSFDAIVTDPPYSSGGQFRGDRMVSSRTKYVTTGAEHTLSEFSGDNRDQRSYLAWSSLWMSASTHVVKPGGLLSVFTDWRQLPITTDAIQSGGWVWRGIATWQKVNARPVLGRYTNQCEFIVWGTNGPRDASSGKCAKGWIVCGYPSGDEREHITQKPVDVMSWLLEPVPQFGSVFDPFCGSGTTLVAGIVAGHTVVGCELSEKNCEIAAKRCDRELDQKRIEFAPVDRVETQRELFAEVANG